MDNQLELQDISLSALRCSHAVYNTHATCKIDQYKKKLKLAFHLLLRCINRESLVSGAKENWPFPNVRRYVMFEFDLITLLLTGSFV